MRVTLRIELAPRMVYLIVNLGALYIDFNLSTSLIPRAGVGSAPNGKVVLMGAEPKMESKRYILWYTGQYPARCCVYLAMWGISSCP